MKKQPYQLQTKLLHNAQKVDGLTGAVSVPVNRTSTFHQFDFDKYGKYDYSRSGNPTRESLEEVIAELEGGYKGFAFASGMAAISTALMILSKGDHLLISEDVYGGTFRFVTKVLPRFGVDYTFVDMSHIEEVAANIKDNTKIVYIETPSNPLMKIADIKQIAKLAKEKDCLTFVDNTFMTPVLQRPLELGADVVLYSATKFIAGHSDCVAGLAVAAHKEIAEQIYFLQNTIGAVLSPDDSWLVLRGLKTLHVRMAQSSRSAQQIAEFLSGHSAVQEVYYPGLDNHADRDIHEAQSQSPGAVLSFSLKDEQSVRIFKRHAEIPVFSVSLGAVESILSYPAKMSHAAMPKQEREKRGITDGLLRFSVGLEDPDDLIKDFAKALSAVERLSEIGIGG
ncbi:cystathionine beta-lyase [Scopulibacillus daqui]|uniref:cysteine-S-conjugate beta-lyase n=1 Tax=Scopulibacillus daqui TaxID=1469162 RepID=A0ABS2Q5N5_9BACL|nr:cystathionine beta-lyase [Scopulibacillus daqui]MBM7646807.1 cystathionine beta-lyase [Scopulibacillus daqui]